jgi:hypothetical protein
LHTDVSGRPICPISKVKVKSVCGSFSTYA